MAWGAPVEEITTSTRSNTLCQSSNRTALPPISVASSCARSNERFVTKIDFAPRETRTFYVYLGMQQRGWNPHRTHAAIGSYMRHTVPFWESANIGWKLWYPTDIDVYGKRKPQLMSNRLYSE